ncbi:prepilin-type N-terminal cleavage/methylation domain-containing protein [Streptobacillus notomytis]|uniref:prepilin-type N-terminal cleavage/methylation domain-containing protein n=1 Tax=Streptobacillus notomytis TaxID=1712031 RepID=UPI00082CB90E|nr:prepilin-type N-terminal cleavage/methylation domain-containing protein [Streptobacillus notomytis]
MRKKKNRGFTLIEIITVIAIIGILASVTVPKISKYIDKANETKIFSAISELNNLYILMNLDGKNDIDIYKVLGEAENLGVNINSGSNNFFVGRFKGEFLIEDGKIIASVTEPETVTYTINGKKK